MNSDLFPGFAVTKARVNGMDIPFVRAGSGPPLLLAHGHPQTHAIWHKTAGALAQRYTVIASDLRGYGDASKPAGSPDHSTYSKREMARDQYELMHSLGFQKFSVVGHDRGGRMAHRLAMDYPRAISKLIVLDISPTLAMYEQTDMAFASAYWHWFFLIQPAPLPETLIGANPEAYLRAVMLRGESNPFAPDAWEEYVRALRDRACVHAICEDYRAATTVDLEHDRADRDAGRKVECSVRVLWGRYGVIERCFDPVNDWRRVASDVTGRALECGHYIPEEAPEALREEIEAFI